MNLHTINALDEIEEFLTYLRWRYPASWSWRRSPSSPNTYVEYDVGVGLDVWERYRITTAREDHAYELNEWRANGRPTTRNT